MPNNKTCIITIVLLSLTLLGLIYFWQAKQIPAPLIQLENIPLQLGQWKGEDLPIAEKTYEILETKDALMREYTNTKGNKVWLAIVYSGVNRGSFHPPEICYLGGGRELLNRGVETLEIAQPRKNAYTMQANKLIMEDKAGKEIAWYWFTTGSRVTSSYYRQQCYFIWDELRHNPAGGSVIRVSTRVTEEGLKEAEERGKNFIQQIAPVLSDYLS